MLPPKTRQTFTFFIVWQEVEAPWKKISTDKKIKKGSFSNVLKIDFFFLIKDQLGHWCYQKTKPQKNGITSILENKQPRLFTKFKKQKNDKLEV